MVDSQLSLSHLPISSPFIHLVLLFNPYTVIYNFVLLGLDLKKRRYESKFSY